MCIQAKDHSERAAVRVKELNPSGVPTLEEIKTKGRRRQDKENLQKHIQYEDNGASRLTRTRLTPAMIKLAASKTKHQPMMKLLNSTKWFFFGGRKLRRW